MIIFLHAYILGLVTAWVYPKRGHILNGTRTDIEEDPFMVIITEGNKAFCGGSIWNDHIIITSAHCLHGKFKIDNLRVYVGRSEPNFSMFDLMYRINKVIIHPNGLPELFHTDIGIAILERKIHFNSYIKARCVPRPTAFQKINRTGCTFLGWGQPSVDTMKNKLQRVSVDIVEDPNCQMVSPYYHSHFNLCGRSVNGTHIVQGDFGGALVCEIIGQPGKLALTGIASYGDEAKENHPCIYTKVSSFMPWLAYIEQNY